MKKLFVVLIFVIATVALCTVGASAAALVGDVNGDGVINTADADYLLMHTFFEKKYPVSQRVDFDGDGDVSADDAILVYAQALYINSDGKPSDDNDDKSPLYNIPKMLENIRQFAYFKDEVVNSRVGTTMLTIMEGIKGKWDEQSGKWITEPKLPYDVGTQRTALYLARLDEAYDRICESIENISLLDEDINGHLDRAIAKVNSILAQAMNSVPSYDESDDMSLAIVYTRYYNIGEYDWVRYNTNILAKEQ